MGCGSRTGSDRSVLAELGLATIASIVIYVFGVTWLAIDTGLSAGRAIAAGMATGGYRTRRSHRRPDRRSESVLAAVSALPSRLKPGGLSWERMVCRAECRGLRLPARLCAHCT